MLVHEKLQLLVFHSYMVQKKKSFIHTLIYSNLVSIFKKV